jgi:hypothetical protein
MLLEWANALSTPIPTHKYYIGFIEEIGRELLGCAVEAN